MARRENQDSGPRVTRADIVAELHGLGLGQGDVVFFHSSLSSFGHVDGGADAVIAAFIEAVGPTGTVAVPTFNLITGDRRAHWDVVNCPSTVGKITERFRHRQGAYRSDHFSHAVAAIGARAEELTRDHPKVTGRDGTWPGAFGVGSPFDRLYHWDAHYLMVGVDFYVCTMLHYCECWLHGDLMLPLDPEAPFLGIDRPVMGVAIAERGLIRKAVVGRALIQHLSARELVDTAMRLLQSDPGPYLREWSGKMFAEWVARHGWEPTSVPWGGSQ